MTLLFMRFLRRLPPGMRRIVLKRVDGEGLDRSLAKHGEIAYRHEGRLVHVDLRDRVGRQMVKHGFTEQPFIALVRRHFTDAQGCFLDIGANLGNYALTLAPYFAKTLAFEPNPPVFARLQRNVEANPKLRIEAFNIGLSSTSGTRAFFPNTQGNSGASGFETRREGIEPLKLETLTGDEFVENLEQRIAAIKIDVEGHEFEVIRGLSRTIARDEPVIFMEWLGETMEAKGGFETLHDLLPGYTFLAPAALSNDGRLKTAAPKHRLTELTPLVAPYRRKYNMIYCVPDKQVGKLALRR